MPLRALILADGPLCRWLEPLQGNPCDGLQAQMELTEGQTSELVMVRENYLERTRKLLQQRQSLWTAVRANLLDTSLEDGCPSAESKV